jgi:hypothetical protein
MKLEEKLKKKIVNFIYSSNADQLRKFTESIFNLAWADNKIKEKIIDEIEVSSIGELSEVQQIKVSRKKKVKEEVAKPKPKPKQKAKPEPKKKTVKKQKPVVQNKLSDEELAKRISDNLKDVPDEEVEGQSVFEDTPVKSQNLQMQDEEDEMMA